MLTVSAEVTKKITAVIRRKYKNVSQSVTGHFQYATGLEGLRQRGYPEELIGTLPEEVSRWYCGVGNPFSLGEIVPGEHVLDLGCGAGVDTILAGRLVGAQGTVTGVDISEEMIQRAENNKACAKAENVSFQVVDTTALPFEDEQFDVITTNAMLNLAVDKCGVLKEAYRVLKKGGRFHIADQFLVGETMDKEQAIDSWFR